MHKIYYLRFLILYVLIASFSSIELYAQNINLGADFVSRYIWRGIDVASTPSIQPTIEYNNSEFNIGVWGAYTLSNSEYNSDEIDLYFGYSLETKIGQLGFSVVDYYFPNGGRRFSNFSDENGAHTFEGTLSFSGVKSFPIYFSAGINFFNDSGYNSYFELGYSVPFNDIEFSFFAGATPGSSKNPEYYGTGNFAFINIGFTAIKTITITEKFSIPLSGSFIINPNKDIAYLVLGITI